MSDGITIIRYIFNKFITLLFDNFIIVTNVSIGWVMVSILIIAIMISNILSVARNSVSTSINKDGIDSYGNAYTENRITGYRRLK